MGEDGLNLAGVGIQRTGRSGEKKERLASVGVVRVGVEENSGRTNLETMDGGVGRCRREREKF